MVGTRSGTGGEPAPGAGEGTNPTRDPNITTGHQEEQAPPDLIQQARGLVNMLQTLTHRHAAALDRLPGNPNATAVMADSAKNLQAKGYKSTLTDVCDILAKLHQHASRVSDYVLAAQLKEFIETEVPTNLPNFHISAVPGLHGVDATAVVVPPLPTMEALWNRNENKLSTENPRVVTTHMLHALYSSHVVLLLLSTSANRWTSSLPSNSCGGRKSGGV